MNKTVCKLAALLLGAATILVGCARDDMESGAPANGKGFTLTATATTRMEPQTKMGYHKGASAMNFTWEKNGTKAETFSAFVQGKGTEVNTFTHITGTGTNNGDFSCTFATKPDNGKELYAIYPALVATPGNTSAIPLDLSKQTLAANNQEKLALDGLKQNPSHYLWAKSTYQGNEVVDFTFEHKVSILELKMKLPSGTPDIKAVSVSGLRTKATIDMTTGELTLDNSATQSVMTGGTYFATPSSDGEITVYIFLFPQKLKDKGDITIHAVDNENKLFDTTLKGWDIEAGKVYQATKEFKMRDVYVAGDRYDVPRVWKNGKPIDCTEKRYSCLYVMAVNGTDIYVAGSKKGEGATYWKIDGNGTVTEKRITGPNPVHDSYLKGITVDSDGTVYTVGAENHIGYVWKNDVYTELKDPDPTNTFKINPFGMALDDNKEVHVIGRRTYTDTDNNSKEKFYYWRGSDDPVELTNCSGVTSIVLANKSVYIGGSSSNGNPAYWKDGSITVMSTSKGFVNAIALSNDGTVYTAGYIGQPSSPSFAVYWKGSTITWLTSTAGSDIMGGAITLGGNGTVYTGGTEFLPLGPGMVSVCVPTYWIGTLPVHLEMCNSTVTAIYVAP